MTTSNSVPNSASRTVTVERLSVCGDSGGAETKVPDMEVVRIRPTPCLTGGARVEAMASRSSVEVLGGDFVRLVSDIMASGRSVKK